MPLVDLTYLVANRHLISTLDQLPNIIFQRVQRYSCQGHMLIITICAGSQHNL